MPTLLADSSFIFGFSVLLTGSGGVLFVIAFLIDLNATVTRLAVAVGETINQVGPGAVAAPT